jgi:hypothetical protein
MSHMEYINGPLVVVRPNTDFEFFLEIGQGGQQFILASEDLSEAVEQLLRKNDLPKAFLDALEEFKELGGRFDWERKQIAKRSEE